MQIKVGQISSSVIAKSQNIIDQAIEKRKMEKDVEEKVNGIPTLSHNKPTNSSEKDWKTSEATLLQKIDKLECKIDEILTRCTNIA